MEILKSKLQVKTYRHVAIAMANKDIRDKFFYPTTPEKDKMWDEQNVHDGNTAGTIYARELTVAPGVVASKREGFKRVGRSWQLFIGFKSWVAGLKRPCPLFEDEEEGEE